MVNSELRRQVITVYKGEIAPDWQRQRISESIRQLRRAELLWMGREYPLGYQYFRDRLHRAFAGQAHLRDEEQIRKGIARAEFVKKEIEAL
ncbi:histidine--tRNA ligase mitochondrial [Penicillium atrosanguineum]|uniref:histidine--tRNA ligase mitochondrial n=1 Tax=Penicillium atrosanguineum TaxID=1132637 RepID=UPI0023912205|nr:histidine--tRNA ligase mitochondrial [Penicillium atrosanguineum]KAJ5292628.1 histidine--tRNA ligase mitochondrial [Penicillium atrosanguineum]